MIEDPIDKFKIDINNYKIINTICRKRHSLVVLVENKTTGRKFAAKTNLNKFKVLTDKEKEFIWGELGFLIRVQHPIFLKFHGFSFTDLTNNKNMTMVMEYMEHGSLSSIIDNSQQGINNEDFDNTNKQIILVGICCGMMILHRHHTLHRDLKPENLLLDQNYKPRLSDVALTKFFDPTNTI